jgi:ferritin-like metal-binding protein YciE
MEGLVEEGKGMLEETEDGSLTRDAALISSAQKIEHYEIASYGTLRTLANTIGLPEAAAILSEILEEEKNTDVKLTQIAESFVNEAANSEK